jgi:hypothetical protein
MPKRRRKNSSAVTQREVEVHSIEDENPLQITLPGNSGNAGNQWGTDAEVYPAGVTDTTFKAEHPFSFHIPTPFCIDQREGLSGTVIDENGRVPTVLWGSGNDIVATTDQQVQAASHIPRPYFKGEQIFVKYMTTKLKITWPQGVHTLPANYFLRCDWGYIKQPYLPRKPRASTETDLPEAMLEITNKPGPAYNPATAPDAQKPEVLLKYTQKEDVGAFVFNEFARRKLMKYYQEQVKKDKLTFSQKEDREFKIVGSKKLVMPKPRQSNQDGLSLVQTAGVAMGFEENAVAEIITKPQSGSLEQFMTIKWAIRGSKEMIYAKHNTQSSPAAFSSHGRQSFFTAADATAGLGTEGRVKQDIYSSYMGNQAIPFVSFYCPECDKHGTAIQFPDRDSTGLSIGVSTTNNPNLTYSTGPVIKVLSKMWYTDL